MKTSSNVDRPNEVYRLISEAESKSTVKGSKFVGWSAPIIDAEDANRLLNERTKLHYNASHHCWAIRYGQPDNVLEKFSDAGEPHGTAGKPILDALKHHKILGALVVVSRWFGGTKLGKGGLVRAYGDCATETLSMAKIGLIVAKLRMKFSVSYDTIGLVENVAVKYGGEVANINFNQPMSILLSVPNGVSEGLINELSERSSGYIVLLESSSIWTTA